MAAGLYPSVPNFGRTSSGKGESHGNSSKRILIALLLLLPYLEQQQLYDRYDFRYAACNYVRNPPNDQTGSAAQLTTSAENAAVVSTQLGVFQCPSDSYNPIESDHGGTFDFELKSK